MPGAPACCCIHRPAISTCTLPECICSCGAAGMPNLAHYQLWDGLEAAQPSAGALPCTQRMSTDLDRRQHRRLQLRMRALLELPQSTRRGTPPCQGARPEQVPSAYQVLGLRSGEKAEARAS